MAVKSALLPYLNSRFETVEIYEEKVLGIGAYGKVHIARCDGLICAAKIVHETLLAHGYPTPFEDENRVFSQFLQEIELLCTLSHPNIVQHIGVWDRGNPSTQSHSSPVLLMELLDSNLTSFLENQRQSRKLLPSYLQVNICHDIALALRFLHHNKVIHRDLSSNNILLDRATRAKLSDFGMAKLYDPDFKKSTRKYLTKVPGTEYYMPPEAFKEKPDYTEKIDCFSFGVLIIQVLTTLYPKPGDRCEEIELTSKYPNVQQRTAEVRRPETDRRKEHIELIEPNNPLLNIALDCIKDDPNKRPSAKEASERISHLKESSDQGERVERVSNVVKEVQDLQENLKEHQTVKISHWNELSTMEARSIIKAASTCTPVDHLKEGDSQVKHDPHIHDTKTITETTASISDTKAGEIDAHECEDWALVKEDNNHNMVSSVKSEFGKLPHELDTDRSNTSTKEAGDAAVGFIWSKGTTASRGIYRCSDAIIYKGILYLIPSEKSEILSYDTIKKEWLFISSCEFLGSSLTIINDHLTTIGGKRTDITYRYAVNPTAGYQSSFTDKILSLTRRGSATNLWSEDFPSMPTRRAFATVLNTTTNVIVAGGIGGAILTTVEILNIETHQWMTAADLPQPMWSASATLLGNKVYMLGGLDGNSHGLPTVVTCNLESLLFGCQQKSFTSRFTNALTSSKSRASIWRMLENVPVTHSTCVSISGSLLAVGGRNSDGQLTNGIYKYDQRTRKWMTLEGMPTARSHCFAIAHSDNTMFIIGGKGTSTKDVDIAKISQALNRIQ